MHRDLKPLNMMLDEEYNLKLIDFGEAKQIGKEEEDEIHRSDARGSFVGTYNYMAPETIGNCSTVLESDLWALGCIVFKMATGKIMIPGKQLF